MMRRLVVVMAWSALLVLVAMTGKANTVESSTRLPFEPQIETVSDSVVVVPGDHLWKISAHHLGAHSSTSDLGQYWRRLIDHNIDTLISGDPDLIYPGEVIRLPAID